MHRRAPLGAIWFFFIIHNIIVFFLISTQANAEHQKQLYNIPISIHPPRPASPTHYRGFPAVVSVHDFVPLDSSTSTTGSFANTLRNARSKLALVTRNLAPPPTRIQVVERYHVVDLLGGITRVGEYYTQIIVGGQPVRVQIDTGSSTLALPMAECASCLSNDLRYNMKRSKSARARWISCTHELCRPDMCSTFKCTACSARDACCSDVNPEACGFRLKYGDKSFARGALVVDDMTWGDNITAPVVFGGILEDSPHFERPFVDGILGMAYKALACNPTCVEPPFQQLVAAGKVEDSFSICVTQNGGKMVLGGFDPKLAQSPPTYVPLALSEVPSYYTVNITDVIDIGGRRLPVPYFRSAIMDSGTTLLVVRSVVFELITKHFKRHYCHVRGLCDSVHSWFRPAACVALPDEEIQRLPTISFTVKPGFVLKLRPLDYMIPYHKNGRDLRCLGIMAMAKLSHGTDAIFGNTVMQRYVTHYDRTNKRMGFALAKSACGAPPKCNDMSTCRECAKQTGCSFDFSVGVCKHGDDGIGLIPYPRCTGNSCLCWLGPQTGLLFGIVAGFAGTLILFALTIFLVALYGRGSNNTNESQYQLAETSPDSEEEALFAAEGDHEEAKRVVDTGGS